MVRDFELINRKENVGTYISETDYIKIVKIVNNRNRTFAKVLMDKYQKITGEQIKNEHLK